MQSMFGNSETRWGLVSQAFHWTMMVLILGMLISGVAVAVFIDDIGLKFRVIQWHKSFGVVILSLTVLRLLWRLSQKSPPLPANLKPYESRLAHLTHYGLYFLMVAQPIAGWLMISSSPRSIPTMIFGWFRLPHLVEKNAELHEVYEIFHAGFGYAFIALIAIHSAAALKHHYVLKDDVLRRMLPFTTNKED